MNKIIAIAAVDTRWGIGHNNNLLFKIPEDLLTFKEKTEKHIVVMGRKTLESLPGGIPLPNRHNVVLSRTLTSLECAFVCSDVTDVFDLVRTTKQLRDKTIWVIGGGEIYTELLPYCQQAHITRIHQQADMTDTYFPPLHCTDGWSLTYTSPIVKSSSDSSILYCGELWENSLYKQPVSNF